MQWVVIDNKLVKNPTKEQLARTDITHIYGGDEDIVIQTWWVNNEHTLCIDFAYSLSMIEAMDINASPSHNPKYDLRKKVFENHGIMFTPQDLKSITIPKSMITEDGIVNLGGYRRLNSFLC